MLKTSIILLLPLVLLSLIGCNSQDIQNVRSEEDNNFIQALVYHHNGNVSVQVDKYLQKNQVDKRIITERVAPGNNYWTPLCFASFIGNRDGVEQLVRHGANTSYKDANGDTPLLLAAISGSIESIELLRHNGADVKAENINNENALVLAAAEGNVETVKFLVEKCQILDIKDKRLNALDFAVFYQHNEIAEYLKGKGMTANNK